MRKQISIAVLALTLISIPAQAGLMLEPYVGYNLGTLSEGPISLTLNGLGFGARVGYGFGNLFLAADARMAPLTASVAGSTGEADISNLQVGGVVGASLTSIRLWGGVNFINTFTFENDSSAKGLGFKLGLGYSMLPNVSLNAEYLINTLTDGCNAAGDCIEDTSSTKTSANSFFMSVSAPFSL